MTTPNNGAHAMKSGAYTNRYDLKKMAIGRKTFVHDFCVICGKPASELHHMVYRSHGGTDGPLVSLCRDCHNKEHLHLLHFDMRPFECGERPCYKFTDTSCKHENLGDDGWVNLIPHVMAVAMNGNWYLKPGWALKATESLHTTDCAECGEMIPMNKKLCPSCLAKKKAKEKEQRPPRMCPICGKPLPANCHAATRYHKVCHASLLADKQHNIRSAKRGSK
jgi:hypothetical protein